ncbi:M23 family metallopeptidase [Ahrensia sp. R2A130]|uniref:M23 family metallopeptidase n=1 Tax=Ahrensia sp. R2A130 TaxID=744979 RepID=UPI0001E0AC57|nr:M23 family metallopeptidase [Ahrensia sp. R2A130]EFL90115.1 peptidase M23B [Ahrensia sp. R2A130]
MLSNAARSNRPTRAKGPAVLVWARGDRTRTWTVRPALMWLGTATMTCLATLTVASGAYLFFQDDLVRGSIEREAQIRQTYEKRISHLRMQVDVMTSRQIAGERVIREKVSKLVEKQRELGQQQLDLKRSAIEAGIADQRASLGSAASVSGLTRLAAEQLDAGDDRAFATLEASLYETEQAQLAELTEMRRSTRKKVSRLASFLKKQGMRLPRATAVGGPLIELSGAANFDDSVRALDEQMETLATVRKAALFLPHGSPTPNSSISSRFGRRTDPFTKRTAVHGGLDFRAARGTPVLSTASGRVVKAGRNGGYGKMVEIDHGGGITTRYAHLSRIHVKKGQKIKRGKRIGKVGSTGRSTGPHLHYEVRRKGRVLDPIHYVRLAKHLSPLLR